MRNRSTAALEALLDATEADYAYIDINRTGNEGQVTWEIVAEAIGTNVPPGPDSFDEGDYSQFPQVIEVLSAGKPARIRVSDLPMPIRARYEAEGIRSELMAPDHDPGPVGGHSRLLGLLAGRRVDRCRGGRVDAGG